MNETTDKFFNAIKRGDVKEINSLVKEGMDVNAKDAWGCIALERTVQFDLLESSRLLLEAGADPNVRLSDGKNILHKAVSFENIRMTTMLLEAGADINKQDDDGNTPLHYASKSMVEDIARNVKWPHYSSVESTEHLMEVSDLPKIVKILIEAGADITISNNDGKTPAMLTNDDQLKSIFSEQETALLHKALEGSPEPVKSAPVRVRM